MANTYESTSVQRDTSYDPSIESRQNLSAEFSRDIQAPPTNDDRGKTAADPKPNQSTELTPKDSPKQLPSVEICCDQLTFLPPSNPRKSYPRYTDYSALSPEERSAGLKAFDKLMDPDSKIEQVDAYVGERNALTKDFATAILNGRMEDVQSLLKKLEDGPAGAEKLEELARTLTSLLGAEVKGVISKDKGFGLDFMTAFSAASYGGYGGGFNPEREVHMVVSSRGDTSTYTAFNPPPRGFNNYDTNQRPAKIDGPPVAGEINRLSRLAGRSIQELLDIAKDY